MTSTALGAPRLRAVTRRIEPVDDPLSYAAPDDPTFPVEKAYEFGAVDYLIKSLIPAVLRAKVAFFVELYRKTEDLARIERERLRESRAQFALLLESCGEGIYGVDLDGI